MEDGDSAGSEEDEKLIDEYNKCNDDRIELSQGSPQDAMADAMLEIAAASKIRATAILENISADMDDVDLALDEMELIAAAAGYYYYTCKAPSPRYSLTPGKPGFMADLMTFNDDSFREMFRMDKHIFYKLSNDLRKTGLLHDTHGVMIEEQFAIFLNIVGHNERNRVIQERFNHSGETISRYFNKVLRAIKSLSHEFVQQASVTTPPEILGNKRFYPYFKDCIGVVDGIHVPAHVPAKDQPRFRNRKGYLSQNVLAACTFDLQFIFTYPGWEGSALDSRVLHAVLNDPDQNFPQIPEGKYYLVDTGYSNIDGFIAPYEGLRSCLHDYKGANQMPRNARELFNHRHSFLRKYMCDSVEVLKARFPILKLASPYAFHIQRDIVIAACVLHNFIRREERHDWLFMNAGGISAEGISDFEELAEMQLFCPIQSQFADSLRDSIAFEMWDDFVNNWDEW